MSIQAYIVTVVLPMSLEDIVAAIQDLQDAVAQVTDQNSVNNDNSGNDDYSLLLDTVNQLQEQVDDMQSTLESLSDLSDRVDALEQTNDEFFGA